MFYVVKKKKLIFILFLMIFTYWWRKNKNRQKEKLEGENLHSRKHWGFVESTHLKTPYSLKFLLREVQMQETTSSDVAGYDSCGLFW